MKKIARYQIESESSWITLSALLMGVAFFIQAMFYLAFGNYKDLSGFHNAMFLIIPMGLEFVWFVLLKGIRLNHCGVYAILSVLVCVLLAVQNFMAGSVAQMILGAISYLLVSGLVLMVIGGYFPYKLFAVAAFGAIAVFRFVVFDVSRFITPGEWQGLITEIPALCMILSVMLFFCGITRKE